MKRILLCGSVGCILFLMIFFENSPVGFIAVGILVAIVYRYYFRFNCVGIRWIRDIVRSSPIG